MAYDKNIIPTNNSLERKISEIKTDDVLKSLYIQIRELQKHSIPIVIVKNDGSVVGYYQNPNKELIFNLRTQINERIKRICGNDTYLLNLYGIR